MTKLFVRSLPCQMRVRRHAREGKRDRRAFSRQRSLSRASGQPVPTCHYESFKFKSAIKKLTFSLSPADHQTWNKRSECATVCALESFISQFHFSPHLKAYYRFLTGQPIFITQTSKQKKILFRKYSKDINF